MRGKLVNKMYGAVGAMTPSGKKAGQAAYNSALNSRLPVGMRGGTQNLTAAQRHAAGVAKRTNAHIAAGKRPTRMAVGAAGLGVSGMMMPKSTDSRTAYRGPMQTGRGVGRYA